jgi:uncharacterized membrane protein
MKQTDPRRIRPRPHALTFLSAGALWCIFLLAGRILHTGGVHYAFLVWNLFLAFLPLLAAYGLRSLRPGIAAWAVLGAWLLFFPNAPYVVTDLLHLRARPGVPQWFDLLLLLSFAFVSLFAGIESLRAVQRWLSTHFSRRIGWSGAFLFLFLGSYGVYLGRFQRWNSWDLLRQPLALLQDIAGHALNPAAHPRTWAFSLGFGVLLSAIYVFVHTVSAPDERETP